MSDPSYLKEPTPFDIEEFHHSNRKRARMLSLCILILAMACISSLVYAFAQRSKVERILDASETQRDYSKEVREESEEKIRMLEQQIARTMAETETQRMMTQQLEQELRTCKEK